jgi:hypothetical protein
MIQKDRPDLGDRLSEKSFHKAAGSDCQTDSLCLETATEYRLSAWLVEMDHDGDLPDSGTDL